MAITTPGMTPGQLTTRDVSSLLPTQPEVAKAEAATTPSPCADDITQQGVQAAQRSLTDEPAPAIDVEKVNQMQTLLASPQFSIDADALASSMLEFFKTRGA